MVDVSGCNYILYPLGGRLEDINDLDTTQEFDAFGSAPSFPLVSTAALAI